jgi:MFS family permease
MSTRVTGLFDHAPPEPTLWHNRAFNVFWTGQTVSMLGDSFSMLALPLLVFHTTGSIAQMGLVAASAAAGQLLSLLVAGAVVDRIDRIKLMIACDLIRTVLLAAIPVAWLFVGPNVTLVYAVAVASALVGDLFSVASQSTMTALVRPRQIIHANARMQAALAGTLTIGPALAGFVCEAFGPAAAIGVDALSFALSAAALTRIRRHVEGARIAPADEPFGRSIAEGFRYLLATPILRSAMIVFALLAAVTAATVQLFVFRLKHDAHATDGAVGAVLAIASVGGVVGALAAPALRSRIGLGACIVSATLLEGVCIAAGGSLTAIAPLVVVAVGYSIGERLRGTVAVSLRQEIVPDRLVGRVTALYWAAIGLFTPLGAATATIAAARFGTDAVLIATGIACAATGAFCLATPLGARAPHSAQ